MSLPRIITALNYIDDDKITAADVPPKKRSPLPLIYSLGGVCAAAVIFGVVTLNINLHHTYPDTSSDTHTSSAQPNSSEYSNPIIADDYTHYNGTHCTIEYDNLPFSYSPELAPEKLSRDYETGGTGNGYSFWAYSITEGIGNNPWNENLELSELPVFYGLSDLPIARILPEHENELPLNHALSDYSDGSSIVNAMLYLADKYSKYLYFEDYQLDVTHDYNINGYVKYNVRLYKDSDNAFEAILNYNFTSAYFRSDNNAILLSQSNSLNTLTAVGFYPIITAQQARQKLIADAEIDAHSIVHTELVYCAENLEISNYTYYKPYYCIYAETEITGVENFPVGMKNYETYYVPAVCEEYLDN